MKGLLWLYPPSWRRRYRREMEALLEETPTTAGALLDLLRGAIDVWLHPQPVPWPATLGRRRSRALWAFIAAAALALALALTWRLLGDQHGLRSAHPWGSLAAGVVAVGAVAVGLVVSLLAALLRRRRRSRRWPRNEDPGEGAPVPARPLPDAPPALTVAGGASRGSGRRSDPD